MELLGLVVMDGRIKLKVAKKWKKQGKSTSSAKKLLIVIAKQTCVMAPMS